MKRRSFLRATSLAPLTLPGLTSSVARNELIRFGICTDLHYDLIPDAKERLTAFVTAMNQQKAGFIIQMGDFCTPKEVNLPAMEVWNQFSGPKYHVIGNHETDGGFNHQQVLDFWQAKAAYYSFDAGNHHFIVLNGNEKNTKGAAKGYPRYIAEEQRQWLSEDLAGTRLPVIVFCHQGIDNDVAGIEEGVAIRRIFEKANEQAGRLKVKMVFSGHHHQDYHNLINGIHYVQINSMSYYWAGEKRNPTAYDEALLKSYPYLNSMLRYTAPLWATVTLFSDGQIEIKGTNSDFLDVSPSMAKLSEAESVYPVASKISNRHFTFPKV